ncbi:MAG: LysE family transporter [Sneathiella sp.]
MSGWEAQIPVVIVITILAVISPGPDFAMTLRNSLVFGRRAGLATSVGIAVGVSIHIIYSILGFSLVLAEAVWLLDVIRYFGAAYLVWLGIQPFRIKHTALDTSAKNADDGNALSVVHAFKSGFLCNALNPKTTMFFVALFSQIVHPETPIIGQLSFGVFIAIAHFIWFAFVAVVLTHRSLRAKFDRYRSKIEKGIGLCLLGLGLRLALV